MTGYIGAGAVGTHAPSKGVALRIVVFGVIFERVQSRGTWAVGRDGGPVYSPVRS